MAKAAKGKGKKKLKSRVKKNVPVGIVHIQATFNNTIVTITDLEGGALSWSSAGSLGFRGSQKGTPFAAQQASMTAINVAREHGLRAVTVRVKGPGGGRESRHIADVVELIRLISLQHTDVQRRLRGEEPAPVGF